jgi:uncharacterized protein YbbC (DUF1343 family)
MTRVSPGVEQFLLHGRDVSTGRVALAGHGASILPDGTRTLDALLAAGVEVSAVLGPEHGFTSRAPEGAAEASRADPATGVPILDCYLATPPEIAEHLASYAIERVVVDFQDGGARFYTYQSTLGDLLGAASLAAIPITVLDRPNPCGGEQAGGPVLRSEYRSFIGRLPLPLRHGLTIGEIARLAVEEDRLDCELEVITMAGWSRRLIYTDTGLPWVPPSPNLPSPTSALCYPGTGLVEGTNLSEGRGTQNPFEIVAAPFGDHRWADELRAVRLPGVAVREVHVTPSSGKGAGRSLTGVGLCVADGHLFDPLRAGLEILSSASRLWPEDVTFSPTRFDLLAGTSELRRALQARESPAGILASFAGEVASFAERVEHLLLYST